MAGGVRRDLWQLGSLLVASESLYVALLRLDAVNGAGPVLTFLAVLAGLFACYGGALAIIRRAPEAKPALVLVVAGAALFRLTLLPAGLPPGLSLGRMTTELAADVRGERVAYDRFLLYDDDHWRYLWDGHVAAHGVNPYAYAPADEAVDALGEREKGPGTDGRTLWADIRDNINHPAVPTVYPPLAQHAFRLSHALAPGSVLVWKGLVLALDLLAALFLSLGLRETGRSSSLVLAYAWNPLVVKAFAGSAHVDALLVALLAGLAFFILRGLRVLAGVALGLAVMAKLSPLVLLPLLVRRLGARGLGAAAAVVGLGYAPFLDAGDRLFRGLAAFARDWEFGAGPFALLRWGFDAAGLPGAPMARYASAALLVGVLAWLTATDSGRVEELPRRALWALGALLMLSPAVMPWYVSWLLPFAILAGEGVWLAFSALVCLSFVVMIAGTLPGWVLWLEWGSFTALLVRSRIRRPDLPVLSLEVAT